MDCTNDHEIAQALYKKEEATHSFFKNQFRDIMVTQECQSSRNDPVNAADEKRLLQGKTRQQYHNDNLKAVKVALNESEERTRSANMDKDPPKTLAQKDANRLRILAQLEARMQAIQFDLGP